MGLIWLALGAIAVWALIRLGRQTEGPGRGEWRIAATIFAAVLIGAGVLLIARGAWLPGVAMTGAGLWLTLGSRIRTVIRRPERLSDAEARALLGVGPSADEVQINAAWRRLMARAHPDQGGSEGLAAQLNAARDRLLKSAKS